MDSSPEILPSALAPAAETPATQGVKTIRVMIAEDHASLRELLANHLAKSDRYEVVCQTAVFDDVARECERLHPQLLILDLDLQGCDGLEAAKAVRICSPETRVLIFSAYTDAATVRRALAAGACGFIEKTAAIETVDRAIAAVALGQAFFGESILKLLPAILQGQHAGLPNGLSDREREVLTLVAGGLTSKMIATRLGLSVRTVENHRSNIMRTMGAHNTADLTREAMRRGLVDLERRPPA